LKIEIYLYQNFEKSDQNLSEFCSSKQLLRNCKIIDLLLKIDVA